ncbi:hypothetical protein FDG2_2798 [Candidatus Protofrankia californiensis]|uniref:DDE Tnp4 domain-containing protein n=1 Tax=Candidatus Protofrankia californiensis TaxID=1839754 RepID=A0A1C3NYC9_9ACTN|nr:hypothetical protein FDG2_2798 [Candidatus Protofrankia californiensis]
MCGSAWTAPRCRYAVPGQGAWAAARSCPGRREEHREDDHISDGQGRLLWSGADRPGRINDQTAMRSEGIADQFRCHPQVQAEIDEGYRGLAGEFPDQVSALPPRLTQNASLGDRHAHTEARRR